MQLYHVARSYKYATVLEDWIKAFNSTLYNHGIRYLRDVLTFTTQ